MGVKHGHGECRSTSLERESGGRARSVSCGLCPPEANEVLVFKTPIFNASAIHARLYLSNFNNRVGSVRRPKLEALTAAEVFLGSPLPTG